MRADRMRRVAGVALLCACAMVAGFAAAQPGPHGHGADMGHGMGQDMGHGMDGMGHGMGGGHGRHGMAAPWHASLTEDQKGEIGWSHLRLRQQQALVDARIGLKEAEIARIITGEEAADDRLQAELDELMALKREHALNHYRHLMEVRQLLNPKQRVAFDLDVLSKRGHR